MGKKEGRDNSRERTGRREEERGGEEKEGGRKGMDEEVQEQQTTYLLVNLDVCQSILQLHKTSQKCSQQGKELPPQLYLCQGLKERGQLKRTLSISRHTVINQHAERQREQRTEEDEESWKQQEKEGKRWLARRLGFALFQHPNISVKLVPLTHRNRAFPEVSETWGLRTTSHGVKSPASATNQPSPTIANPLAPCLCPCPFSSLPSSLYTHTSPSLFSTFPSLALHLVHPLLFPPSLNPFSTLLSVLSSSLYCNLCLAASSRALTLMGPVWKAALLSGRSAKRTIRKMARRVLDDPPDMRSFMLSRDCK
eukprot:5349-Hanusia_phi.AAC.3